MCHDGDVINWQPTPLLTKHGALIRGFCSCLWRCMMHHTASIQELVGYKWVQTFKSLLTFTVRSRSMETLNSTVTGWLVGLGVWFSLRVREVPGSNPGRAFSFCLSFTHSLAGNCSLTSLTFIWSASTLPPKEFRSLKTCTPDEGLEPATLRLMSDAQPTELTGCSIY